MLTISKTHSNDCYRIDGFVTEPDFLEPLQAFNVTTVQTIKLDCQGLIQTNSLSVAWLINLKRQLKQQHCRLIIENPPQQLLKLFELYRLEGILN